MQIKDFGRTVVRRVLGIALAILALPAAVVLKLIRRIGVEHLPVSKAILLRVGVFPIRAHYYEPLFDGRRLRKLGEPRPLPGIDWNTEGQLKLLSQFGFSGELSDLPQEQQRSGTFYVNNPTFGAGDAEYWYNVVRHFKPRRIVEIGSGFSTLMARRALERNRGETGQSCDHICVEPYEMAWLEATGVQVIREKVEDVDRELFRRLERNDVLFIDSSHVIRPQGDVLCEFLELLPQLKPGVIVHVHDIFSPRDYPTDWIVNKVILWNEQYLLEAFLTGNRQWQILGALNYLKHLDYERVKSCCPYLTPDREPGSFYMQRTAS